MFGLCCHSAWLPTPQAQVANAKTAATSKARARFNVRAAIRKIKAAVAAMHAAATTLPRAIARAGVAGPFSHWSNANAGSAVSGAPMPNVLASLPGKRVSSTKYCRAPDGCRAHGNSSTCRSGSPCRSIASGRCRLPSVSSLGGYEPTSV